MKKDDIVYVGHMFDSAMAAVGKLHDCPRDRFDADDNLRLALTHLIQTIGEAARQVSTEFRQRNDSVPWAKIIGMRNKVVHDYMQVDYDLVWDVVIHELPGLIVELGMLVAPPTTDHGP